MINSPVLELQALASDRNSDIVGVLLKAKMIAVKLGLKDLTEWIEYEIDGYPSDAEIPEYRIGQGIIRYWNPYHGWQNLEFRNVPPDLIATAQEYAISESISSMQKPYSEDGTLRLALPPSFIELLFKGQRAPSEICWFFSVNKLTHIVTTVRNKILDWSLELEANGVLGMGLLFNQKEKEAASMTVQNITNIHGNVNNAGVIGSGNGDITQNNSVTAGDFSSLEKQLKEWGVSDEDIITLHHAVQESPAPTSADNFGSRIGEWIGNTIGKAYAGTLRIAGSAAPVLLTNAICHYYGIPV
ncbi:abortive phage resistance protein [Enterobacter hormaechei]